MTDMASALLKAKLIEKIPVMEKPVQPETTKPSPRKPPTTMKGYNLPAEAFLRLPHEKLAQPAR